MGELVRLRAAGKQDESAGPPAQDGVNLTVLTGEAVALTGRLGRGASRLRSLVAGLDRPTEDQVEVIQALVMRSVRTAAQEDIT
jgi:predicted ABC-type transport system involved in lysophospholipase L1 biosynthesis ATPase subunit